MDPKTVSNDGGMDANWIVAHGIPTVTFGEGQRDVHTSDEWIALEDFAAACRLVTQLAEVVQKRSRVAAFRTDPSNGLTRTF